VTVREIATWLNATVVGPDTAEILRPAKIEEAGEGTVTFLANPKYARFLGTTNASAVLVSPKTDIAAVDRPSIAFLVVPDPYVAFLKILKRLVPQVDPFHRGIHPTAIVAPTATLGASVSLGAGTIIADGVRIGDHSVLGAGVIIGKNAVIGQQCTIYDGVVVYHGSILGSRIVVHSGTVIGSDGFGFAPDAQGVYEKIPQLGIVHIHDDVEIGSNCSIDRATLGETVIHRGVKLDNLIQIAHNVVVGEHTVIASQTGVSGSSKIGKHCRIAGQVGISGHVDIADHTTLLGQTGVSKTLEEPGRTWFGTPQREHVRAGRIEAVVRMLPEMRQELETLRKQIEELTAKLTK
jgi:UDP-3-O-[3-hydroxymyristoyl] glucosamine N-acyltransferase